MGYLPLIPGTFGSMAGVLVFYLVRCCPGLYLAVLVCVTLIGFLVCGKAEKTFGKKDPRYVVIDEVCGMLIALFLLPAYDTRVVIMGFFIFRLMDTVKPFPIDRIESAKGSYGIMGDDIVAGLYTNLILQAALRMASFRIS